MDDHTDARESGSRSEAAEARVGTVGADRLCLGCGYNLIAQPVMREPHYELLMARCPECGRAAPIQEYPLLGRWAGRWALLLAALFLLLTVVLWAASGLGVGLTSMLLGELSSETPRRALQQGFQAWNQEHSPETRPTSAEQVRRAKQWIESMGGVRQAVRDLDDQRSAARWVVGLVSIPVGLGALLIGTVWSILLAGQSRSRVVLTWILIMIGALIVLGIEALAYLGPEYSWWSHITRVSWIHFGLPGRAIGLLVTTTGVATGLLVGRSIARGVIRLFLPPRARQPLAGLWLADGLAPPPIPMPRIHG